MKTFRSTAGPLRERPYYTIKEIEDICLDALRSVDLLPASPEPIRVERFIEKRFGVAPAYRDLPEGLLGYTAFGPKGVEEVVIARGLVENATRVAERQANSTLAHEAGHGLLQGHLFALHGQHAASLFGQEMNATEPKVLCRNPRPLGSRGYDGHWWEFQANQAIGALLLPKPLIIEAVRAFLVPSGTFGVETLAEARRDEAVRHLADTFDVNPTVARIRLGDLFPETTQLTL